MRADRPVLHLTPAAGWLNDANGLVHWKGRHHVFYQSDPLSLWFGRMQWGHYSSDDLVHWTRHPAALSPSKGPDVDGVWTGSVVDNGGTATAVYTGVVSRPDGSKIQSVCLATSTDPDLLEWVKDPDNPVSIEAPPFDVDAFRDPYVWRHDDGWCMLLGTGLPGGHGGVLRYRSSDLREWHYQGIFLSGADLPDSAPWSGAVWECPNLAILKDGTALLLVSVHDPATLSLHYTVALIGRIDQTRFVASSARRLDHGHDCYAAAIETTTDGRVLAYGWAWEALSPTDREQQQWSGCMTVPRELGVLNGVLTIAPARELGPAASVIEKVEPVTITAGHPIELVAPRAARIDATFHMDHTSALRVALRRSPESGEELTLDYSPARGSIVVDRSRASTLAGVRGGVTTAEYPLRADGYFDLTVIIDHTIVEVFIDNVIAFSERIYPQAVDSDQFRIECRGETFGEKPPYLRLESLTLAAYDESRFDPSTGHRAGESAPASTP